MLYFPDNPLLKSARVSGPQTTAPENSAKLNEDIRRKLAARESDILELKAVIARQQERIMELQFQQGNRAEDRRFAAIPL